MYDAATENYMIIARDPADGGDWFVLERGMRYDVASAAVKGLTDD
jgi:hypothetical protein